MTITLTYDPVAMSCRASDPYLKGKLEKFLTVKNPDYYNPYSQKTTGDEYICFYESNDGKILTGLLSSVKAFASTLNTDVVLKGWPEKRTDWDVPKDLLFGITLEDYQIDCIKKCLQEERGILELATGSGKGEICVSIARMFNKQMLYIVPDLSSMHDIYNRFLKRKFKKRDVGMIGEGYNDVEPKRKVYVACVSSMYSGIKKHDDDILRILNTVDVLIEEESHHLQAWGWQVVAGYCRARYRYGMSGTPYKDKRSRFDPLFIHPYDSWLKGYTGDTLAYIPPSVLQGMGKLTKCRVVSFSSGNCDVDSPDWATVYKKGIIDNSDRNKRISYLAANLSDMGCKPLISVEKLRHGRILQKLLKEMGIVAACSYGQGVLIVSKCILDRLPNGIETAPVPIFVEEDDDDDRPRKRYNRKRELLEVGEESDFVHIPADTSVKDLLLKGIINVIIGSRIYDECMDIPFLTDLINAAGGKADQRFRQKIGRVLRLYPGKSMATVWEPWDCTHGFLLKHSRLRVKIAKGEGYEVISTPTLLDIDGEKVNSEMLFTCRIKNIVRNLSGSRYIRYTKWL
jgi:hypothetical protein